MTFEIQLHDALHKFLLGLKNIDAHWPECPDVEEKWVAIGNAYLPDGVREYEHYPTASLGWMMYIGMAMAKYWDQDWEIYGPMPDVYAYMRGKRGYDNMDEYIMEDALMLRGDECKKTEKLVGDCATMANDMLRHHGFEPSTPEAFQAYVACLRQLYLMGMAVQLHTMGYHMTKIQ